MAKTKKMTVKDFKDALESAAGMNFDNWGWEGILNLIACEAQYAAADEASKGLNAIATHNRARATSIEMYLAARGYYDSKK